MEQSMRVELTAEEEALELTAEEEALSTYVS